MKAVIGESVGLSILVAVQLQESVFEVRTSALCRFDVRPHHAFRSHVGPSDSPLEVGDVDALW
jgi:hypothetical protein